MRRLSVAVHNTIPKKLRERIDVPSILVIADSDSSLSEEEDSASELTPKGRNRKGKKKRKVRRASESDAGSSFRPLFAARPNMDLILPPPNRGSGEPPAESFVEAVLRGISQELSPVHPENSTSTPSNFNFLVIPPQATPGKSPVSQRGSSPALFNRKRTSMDHLTGSPRSGSVFRRKFSIPVPLLSLKGRLFRKRISEGSGYLAVQDDAEGGNLDNRNSSKLLRYEFTKDEVYLGEVMDNKAHGHGVLHFRGCQYGGHWENGMERIGCYLWPSGVQYHGTWEAGYRHGNGVEKHATYVYKGEWVKDAKQGYGVASSQSGCMYEGTWKNNRHEGYGVEVYKDEGFYAGQFNQGIRDGHGVRVFHPNSRLKDAFANKTLTDSSSEVPSATDLERLLGDKIFCEFEEGDKTEIYRGQWKNDKREGPGIERDSQGDVYEGHFKDNMRHGYGVLKSKGGRIYYGRWKKNKLIQNNRTSNSSCQKAELSAQEGCSVATRKTWLALSRAHGARRFASWAVHSQREAYKHYALSEEKERDARALVDVGNVGANIVAQKFQEMSPSSIARRGLSKLSDIFSPLPSRKSISSTCSEMEDSPNLSNRRLSNSHRFLKPAS